MSRHKAQHPRHNFLVEAIASRLEAIASRWEAIASRLEAIASRLEAIPSRLEAIDLSINELPRSSQDPSVAPLAKWPPGGESFFGASPLHNDLRDPGW